MTEVASLTIFRMRSPAARAWAFALMGAARPLLAMQRGLGFWKLCGSGMGEGFTPVPNTAVWAILAVWESAEAAQDGVAAGRAFRSFRYAAEEDWTVFLHPTSARGQWSGRAPFTPAASHGAGPVAALTRATLRAPALARFWRRVPDISARIGGDTDVLFKIGIGEVPWLHQVTFSIWPDIDSMNRFARSGPHADAIAAVRREGWFREELYARFDVVGARGTWGGRAPLETLTQPEAA